MAACTSSSCAPIVKVPQKDTPTLDAMRVILRAAERANAKARQSSSIFNPRRAISYVEFLSVLQELGLDVLVSQSSTTTGGLQNLYRAIQMDWPLPSPSPPSGVGTPEEKDGGVLLMALFDWLPTMKQLDCLVPGVTAVTNFISDNDFAVLQKKLPTARTAAAKSQRDELFKGFDPNGNGMLSLAEIDKGARDVLKLHLLFDCKPVLMRAYQAARRAEPPSARNHNGDFVSKRGFRILLWYLKQYFNLWQLFCKADSDGDRRVSLEEFTSAVPQLVSCGLLSDAERGSAKQVFGQVDRDGGGMILFEEFCAWALARGLIAETQDGDGDQEEVVEGD